MSGLTNADTDVVQGLLLEWETRLHSGRPVSPEELCRDRPELLCSLRQQVRLLELMGASEDGFASTNSPVSEFVESQEPAGVGELTSAKGDFAGVRFAPLRFHARGGLGEVWQAQDLELGREVALKTIPAHRRGDPDSRTRFFREAEITGRLDHPGVVPVFGMGVGPTGAPYYAMRFVRGETLTAAIETFHAGRCQGPREVAFRRLLGRFVAVCQTVAYAHSRGVIHRDLKPDNILLGPFGETLVVDWGLAKQVCADGGSTPVDWPARGLPPAKPGEFSEVATMVTGGGQSPTVSGPTTVGTVVGTPGYMSPEQASGLPVGPATDLYALGVTLAVLLVGQIPTEVLSTLRRGKTAAKAPPALWAVACKACAPRPTDRYPDASALAAEVERWLADEPVSAWREPFAARAARWMRRHRTLVTSVAVLLCSMSVALSVGLVAVRREQSRTYDEWQRAEENAATAHAAADISALNARRARAAEAIAERRAELARAQYGLAVGALESLVTNVQDRLAKTPGTRSLQEDILADALVRLYQLAEETHRLGDQQTATTATVPWLTAPPCGGICDSAGFSCGWGRSVYPTVSIPSRLPKSSLSAPKSLPVRAGTLPVHRCKTGETGPRPVPAWGGSP